MNSTDYNRHKHEGCNDLSSEFSVLNFDQTSNLDMEDKVELYYHAILDHDTDQMEELVKGQLVDVNYIFKGDYVQSWHNGCAGIHILAHNHKQKLGALQKILQLGARIDLQNKTGDTAIHIACKHGNHKSVKCLLNQDISCKDLQNNHGITPLLKALFHIQPAFRTRYIETIKLLINADCDVNLAPNSGITPLHVAAEKWYPGITQLLVKAGGNVNARSSNGMSPLLTAICGKGNALNKMINQDVVKVLVESGADPNVTMPSGRSPLHMAVSKSDDIIVQHLLKAGADANLTDNYGKTPLYLAVQDNNITILPILVSHGGNVNFKPEFQEKTLLELSVSHQQVKMVNLLLSYGAKIALEIDINTKNIMSDAVYSQNIDLVKMFLKENCPLNEPRIGPRISPIEMSLTLGNVDISRLLVKAGAEIKHEWLDDFDLKCDDEDFKQWLMLMHSNPRSLLELTRSQIRQLFGFELKARIESIKSQHLLPDSLVDYLMLQDLIK